MASVQGGAGAWGGSNPGSRQDPLPQGREGWRRRDAARDSGSLWGLGSPLIAGGVFTMFTDRAWIII